MGVTGEQKGVVFAAQRRIFGGATTQPPSDSEEALTMTSMAMLACSGCWNPIGAGAQPIWLADLVFHDVCTPRCRACGARLTAEDEHRWSFDGQVIPSQFGYALRPTEFWCEDCRELHDRDLAFAQD
ncbi:MAG: hypothetical protein IT305_15720 [Chloroflexi bacterium]|nr:hypothetical protein [Chloroflexota bacterium]